MVMLSPCGGCDPHLVAAIVCYLSFFISGCSLFLYWYWLGNYRDEINPCRQRSYSSPSGSDCDFLEPEPIDQNDEDDDIPGIGFIFDDNLDDPIPSTSTTTTVLDHHQEISNISRCVQEDETAAAPTDHLLLYLPQDSSIDTNLGSWDSFVINTISLPFIRREEVVDCGRMGDFDSILSEIGSSCGGEGPVGGGADGDGDGEGTEEQGAPKKAVSGNPYLNGNTYNQNLLWGLHGIFTNLVEAILAAIFYSGLFENNLTTTLIFVIGFSSNFIIGNFLYVLLLLYCTNRSKVKQLWLRWVIESGFNVGKDLYYIWVGVAFLDSLVKRDIINQT